MTSAAVAPHSFSPGADSGGSGGGRRRRGQWPCPFAACRPTAGKAAAAAAKEEEEEGRGALGRGCDLSCFRLAIQVKNSASVCLSVSLSVSFCQ